jgi:hypothetical protein
VRRPRRDPLARALGNSGDQSTPIEVDQELVEFLPKRMGSDEPMPRRLSKLLVAEVVAQENGVTNLADCAERLQAMDRYERRALSRCKFAIRDFDAARRH